MSDSRLSCLTLVVGNKAGELHSSNDTRDPDDTIWQFCDQISLQSDAVWKLWLLFWIGLDGGNFHFIVDVFYSSLFCRIFVWAEAPLHSHQVQPAVIPMVKILKNIQSIKFYCLHQQCIVRGRMSGAECIVLIKNALISTLTRSIYLRHGHCFFTVNTFR